MVKDKTFNTTQQRKIATCFNKSGQFIYTEADKNNVIWSTDSFMAVAQKIEPTSKYNQPFDKSPSMQPILDRMENDNYQLLDNCLYSRQLSGSDKFGLNRCCFLPEPLPV